MRVVACGCRSSIAPPSRSLVWLRRAVEELTLQQCKKLWEDVLAFLFEVGEFATGQCLRRACSWRPWVTLELTRAARSA